MTEWFDFLKTASQAASFVAILIVTTFATMQRGTVKSQKETIEGLRGDRDDMETRLENRDRLHAEELARRDGQLEAATKRISDLEAEVAALGRTVTGEVHLTVIEGLISDLSHSLAAHHAEAMAGLAAMQQAQTEASTALLSVVAAIKELREAA